MSKSIQFKDNENEKIYPHPYYPIGSIFLSVVNTNPSTWFGGTWEQIAKGRTLVGVDINDTDFNIVEKIGGEKKHTLTINEMPSHTHKYKLAYGGNDPARGLAYGNTQSGTFSGDYIQNTGENQAHNNMPPYFTCYIWCRTA